MPKIVFHPRLDNRIRIVDLDQYWNASRERQEELMRWYEDGELIVLRGYRFESGRDVLSTVTFPNERRAKKIILSTPEDEHLDGPRDREWKLVKEELLAGDADRIHAFYGSVVAANRELLRLAQGLFPRYRYTRKLCIYNLSEMLAHNLHFDSPQHAGEATQLRIFVNLDSIPRIWHVSDHIEKMTERFYEGVRLDRTIGDHPREFTRRITHGVFGDRYESGSHTQPKHSLAFYPGEVWFLNPNMTAHEVVYGRRLLDGVFLFDQQDLLDPTRYYPSMVERIHIEHLGRARYLARRLWGAINRRRR